MKATIQSFQKKFNKELKSGLLSLLVMLVINQNSQPNYGYKIIRTLEKVSGGRFKFPEGTIYPILSSLLNNELLESYWGNSLEGPRRKYYKLTTRGKDALQICLEDWNTISNLTQDIIKQLEGDK